MSAELGMRLWGLVMGRISWTLSFIFGPWSFWAWALRLEDWAIFGCVGRIAAHWELVGSPSLFLGGITSICYYGSFIQRCYTLWKLGFNLKSKINNLPVLKWNHFNVLLWLIHTKVLYALKIGPQLKLIIFRFSYWVLKWNYLKKEPLSAVGRPRHKYPPCPYKARCCSLSQSTAPSPPQHCVWLQTNTRQCPRRRPRRPPPNKQGALQTTPTNSRTNTKRAVAYHQHRAPPIRSMGCTTAKGLGLVFGAWLISIRCLNRIFR